MLPLLDHMMLVFFKRALHLPMYTIYLVIQNMGR